MVQQCEGLEALSVPFTKEEIDHVIKIILTDCAPGPDGFNGHLLKVCWDVIKEDFERLCDDFWDGKINIKCLNNSLISLIPKSSCQKR